MVITASETPQSGIQIYLKHPWNLIKTAFLVVTWVVLGFHVELVGPTMSILAQNIHVTFNGFASALASRGGGYLAGNVLGAVFQKIVKNHSEAVLAMAFFVPTIAVFATPFATSLTLMCVLFFLQGLGLSFTDLGGNNLIFKMWGVNAAAPLNIAQLGYGLGAIFVNLLVRPYLDSESPRPNVNAPSQLNSTLSSVVRVLPNSNIRIPYSMTAGLCLLVGIGHLVFYVWEQKNGREKVDIQQVDYSIVSTSPENVHAPVDEIKFSQYSPATCGRGFFGYGLTLSSIFIAYTFFVGGNDQLFSKFFFEYMKFERFGISNAGASWGMILYWLSYSIGRLICAIISVFVAVNLCLTIIWFGGLCLAVAWMVYVWVLGLTATSLFILGALTGLVFSPIFPLSFGLMNQRLDVVPVLLALLLCGSGLGMITFQKLAGFVMDHDSNHFPTLLFVCITMAILLYISSNVVEFFHQRNLKNRRLSVTNGAALVPADLGAEEQAVANYLRGEEEKPC